MNKKKLVFFTCSGFLLILLLYIFYPKQAVPPTQPVSQVASEPQEVTSKKSGREKKTSFTPSYPESDKRGPLTNDELQEQLENLKKFCEEEFPQYKDTFPSVKKLQSVLEDKNLEQTWLNLHLKDANKRVWRLRRFIDDGPNGGVERVVLYKEDETGFPRIVESSENQKEKSASQLFQEYLKKGDPIFTDEAYSNLYEGADYFFELTNGQITRIDVTSNKGHINCQVPH